MKLKNIAEFLNYLHKLFKKKKHLDAFLEEVIDKLENAMARVERSLPP